MECHFDNHHFDWGFKLPISEIKCIHCKKSYLDILNKKI